MHWQEAIWDAEQEHSVVELASSEQIPHWSNTSEPEQRGVCVGNWVVGASVDGVFVVETWVVGTCVEGGWVVGTMLQLQSRRYPFTTVPGNPTPVIVYRREVSSQFFVQKKWWIYWKWEKMLTREDCKESCNVMNLNVIDNKGIVGSLEADSQSTGYVRSVGTVEAQSCSLILRSAYASSFQVGGINTRSTRAHHLSSTACGVCAVCVGGSQVNIRSCFILFDICHSNYLWTRLVHNQRIHFRFCLIVS